MCLMDTARRGASAAAEIWNENYSRAVCAVKILVCKSREELSSQWIQFLADEPVSWDSICLCSFRRCEMDLLLKE